MYRKVSVLKDRKEIINLALKNKENKIFVVGYDTKDNSSVAEATVTKCKNGLVINFLEKYSQYVWGNQFNCGIFFRQQKRCRISNKKIFSPSFLKWSKESSTIFF